MNNPYRDPPAADADEGIPNFRGREPRWYDFIPLALIFVLFFAPTAIALLQDGVAEAVFALKFFLPGFAISVATQFLERPVRARLERRYARVVAEGVVELEAKAAALEAMKT